MARKILPGRRVLGIALVCLLSAFTLAFTAGTAAAAFKEKTGHHVKPGQTVNGKQRAQDWLGTYEVNGKQVFCVQFLYKAPDTNEEYKPGDELKTKWGDALSKEVAANISYLLLRHGDTTNPDEAAALAHLLHSWTSPARDGHDDLNPSKDFKNIAYDEKLHFNGLPKAAQDKVDSMKKDAEANRGPWTASVTTPEEEQTIGTAAEWSVTVKNAKDKGVPDVPITITLSDATAEKATAKDGDAKSSEETNGEAKNTPENKPEEKTENGDTPVDQPAEDQKITVKTDKNGVAKLNVTPTGENPKLVSSLSGPADKPYVQAPVEVDTQRVVSTGGEKELKAEGTVKAKNKPGIVQVTKLDSKTGAGISGVSLRVTAKDKTSAATGEDGKPLVGDDDKPLVVTTSGDEGKATVEKLKTPQEICVVEVSAPEGYDQGFDPNNPPSACGEVKAGETLALQIKNVPNEVPKVIPAGTEPVVTASSGTSSNPSTAGLIGLGVVAALGSAGIGFVARRQSLQGK